METLEHPDDLADFAEFYDATVRQIYRYVAYRVAETATAEDLTSAIFENALRAWKRRCKPEAQMAWIFRIARNTVISHYRHNQLHSQAPEEMGDAIPDDTKNPEQQWIDQELRQRVHGALLTLNAREQDLIALKFGSGLTNRAISPILGLSESNVAVTLHRALKKVQRALSENATTKIG